MFGIRRDWLVPDLNIIYNYKLHMLIGHWLFLNFSYAFRYTAFESIVISIVIKQFFYWML